MKVSVEWLKDYVAFRPPVESAAERLTMAGLEVKAILPSPNGKGDLFEVEVTSNRPDWLSHMGVAREMAAVENLVVNIPEIYSQDTRQMPQGWKIKNKDIQACPYYTGVLIEGIEMAQTPDFMRDRLEACGMRCVNLIVDITNYVLLETGQPLHAFDADMLEGKEIQVRFAKDGEKMTAIDGAELKLTSKDLVIADGVRPHALAGVMGGKESEVTARTKSIFLESAFFIPHLVRQSSRRHMIASESSYRFERRVDPEGVEFASRRALHFIKKYAKPRFISNAIQNGTVPAENNTKLHLKAADVVKVLGVEIKPGVISSVLTRLGLNVKARGGDAWEIGVPSFRSDLKASVDLIEEVVRIYGFDNIPASLPAIQPTDFTPNPLLKLERKARNFMIGCGFFESVTFSLISDKGLSETWLDKTVQIINPQHKEMRWLRPVMVPSLLQVAKHNFDHGAAGIDFFEIGKTYWVTNEKKKSAEEKTLAFMISGVHRKKSWVDAEREAGYFDLKGILEAFMQSCRISDYQLEAAENDLLEDNAAQVIRVGGEAIGFLGEVSRKVCTDWGIENNVFAAEISLARLVRHMGDVTRHFELPKYPAVERDLAVVVSEDVDADSVIRDIQSRGEGLIRSVEVFDVFQGGRIPKGFKNIGYRVTYQSSDRTLVSEEVQSLHSRIATEIADKYQAQFQK